MKRVASGFLPMLAVDRKLGQPLHRQIYEAFRSAIVQGRLRPGQQIPSSRVLAVEIAVSRFPVLNAYAQLLAEGYLESRVGAGTVVSASLPEQPKMSAAADMRVLAGNRGPRRVANRCSLLPKNEKAPWMMHRGAFRVGQVAVEEFPLSVWASLISRESRNLNTESAHYGELAGELSLRRAIAN